jgi:hypothetical protein
VKAAVNTAGLPACGRSLGERGEHASAKWRRLKPTRARWCVDCADEQRAGIRVRRSPVVVVLDLWHHGNFEAHDDKHDLCDLHARQRGWNPAGGR